MGLHELTDPIAVLTALNEFDELGRDAFLRKYRFGRARDYFIEHQGSHYDSKAVVGVAHFHQFGELLRSRDFSGGNATVVPVLAKLGFRVATGEQWPPMKEMLQEALQLQSKWSQHPTPAMNRRGQLVRSGIPTWLRHHFVELSAAVTWPGGDLAVEGSDGVGRKTEIPWVRLYSASRSPSATTGWYVVLLLDALGDHAYLTLMPGTTRWDGGEFKPRPAEEVAELVSWARSLLGDKLNTARVQGEISLSARRSALGPAYEAGAVAAFRYGASSLPNDGALLQDLVTMLAWLSDLYGAETEDPLMPGVASPEVAIVEASVRDANGEPLPPGRGQGFRLLKAEQRAIEMRAMEVTSQHLVSLNWSVRDVSAKESYDLRCHREGEELYVEVKGTVSHGSTVLLTRNEVHLHRQKYPHNALAVVSEIVLDRTADAPTASGGRLVLTSPWLVDDADLEPIAYTYRTGRQTSIQAAEDAGNDAHPPSQGTNVSGTRVR